MWSKLILPIAILLPTIINAAPDGNGLTMPPPIPDSFPPTSQANMIPDSFLAHPLVVDALAHVQRVVPEQYLRIRPATYQNNFGNIRYNDDASKWALNQRRHEDTDGFRKDVYDCPNSSDWGLTYDDGPSGGSADGQNTAAIVKRLNDMGVKATFFLVGGMAINNPEALKNSYDAGMEIAVSFVLSVEIFNFTLRVNPPLLHRYTLGHITPSLL